MSIDETTLPMNIWLERNDGVVPTEFETLVEKLVVEPELKKAIDTLIQSKRKGEELDFGPRIEPISQFVEQELEHFVNFKIEHEKHIAPIDKLNDLFIEALDEVWGSLENCV